ncbi:Inner membrane protein YghB [compost metagenome]
MIMQFIDIILHLDQHLPEWIAYFGPWFYVIMFLIIFAETGLVVTPFLPGDSLLFALGAMTTFEGGLNLWVLLVSLIAAGIIGDTVNYHIGQYLGPMAFERHPKLFKKEYLVQTQKFYDRWGAFTVVAARFAPIVRTFAPFVAGVGSMHYRKFLSYNVIGAILWVGIFLFAGHFFGNLPIVKRNFHIVIFGVIGVSLIPVVWPFIQAQIDKRKAH